MRFTIRKKKRVVVLIGIVGEEEKPLVRAIPATGYGEVHRTHMNSEIAIEVAEWLSSRSRHRHRRLLLETVLDICV